MDSGISFAEAALPRPDLSDPRTVQDGCKKRLGAVMPQLRFKKRKIRRLVFRILKRAFPQGLSDQDIPSLETWLAHTTYTEAEKQIIRDAVDIDWSDPNSEITRREARVFASFIKAESYLEFKPARTIQGLSPAMKKFLGPIIHAIEQLVFKSPYFAKFVPVSQRARWCRDIFADFVGYKIAASDFTSFEQSWKADQMEMFELPLFEYLLKSCECSRHFLAVLRLMELRTVVLVFKFLRVIVGAMRKSGTTNTSLSNGVGNWLIHEVLGIMLDLGDLIGVFEGDDGLFLYSSGRFPTPQDYADLGFIVKLDIYDDPSAASFCGLVYDPVDCINITDPVKVLCNIGWLSHYYCRARSSKLKSLLRAKAMSLAVQCPDVPILAEAAQWLLRATRSVDARWVFKSRNTSWWDRQILSEVKQMKKFEVTPSPPPNTRLLMADKFGVSVEVQHRAEAWFKSQDKLVQMPYFFDEIHPDHARMAEEYIRQSKIPALDSYPIFPDMSGELEVWTVAEPPRPWGVAA